MFNLLSIPHYSPPVLLYYPSHPLIDTLKAHDTMNQHHTIRSHVEAMWTSEALDKYDAIVVELAQAPEDDPQALERRVKGGQVNDT